MLIFLFLINIATATKIKIIPKTIPILIAKPVFTEIINCACELSLSVLLSFSFAVLYVFETCAIFVSVPIEPSLKSLVNTIVSSLLSPGFNFIDAKLLLTAFLLSNVQSSFAFPSNSKPCGIVSAISVPYASTFPLFFTIILYSTFMFDVDIFLDAISTFANLELL